MEIAPQVMNVHKPTAQLRFINQGSEFTLSCDHTNAASTKPGKPDQPTECQLGVEPRGMNQIHKRPALGLECLSDTQPA